MLAGGRACCGPWVDAATLKEMLKCRCAAAQVGVGSRLREVRIWRLLLCFI
jgi:hypothetical protein